MAIADSVLQKIGGALPSRRYRIGNRWDRHVVSDVVADVSPRILYRVKISADSRQRLRQKRASNEIHFKRSVKSGI
jgi:hypothetical protein